MIDTSKGTNHSVYEKRLTKTPKPTPGYTYVPHCIYFYYVRFDTNGKVRVDHYLWPPTKPDKWTPIPHAAVPGIMEALIVNARPRTKKKKPKKLDSNNFDPVPWSRKSYVAIFIDEANWRFSKEGDGRPSVVFNTDEGAANHSFFDAVDVLFDVPIYGTKDSDRRSGIYFVNHMKGMDGEDIGDDVETFKFNLNLIAGFANTSQVGARLQFDPGGSNEGPPEQP